MGKKAGNSKILMVLGLVLALISGGIVFVITQTSTSPAKPVLLQKIIVASRDIPERTVVTETMVREVNFLADDVPKDSIADRKEIINKFVKERVRAGQPILGSQLAVTGKPGEQPPQTVGVVPPAVPAAEAAKPRTVDAAFSIDKGKVMVAVDYPGAAKLVTAGVLQPGDKVDIYVKAPGITSEQIALIFSNIEIKAIGKLSTAGGAASPSPTLIFVVPPQDALVLKYLETLEPFLLLRAAGDEETLRTDLVTMDYLVARFRLQRPLPR